MATKKKTKERSPRYPIVSLREAIDKVRVLYEREGKSFIAREVAVKAWGYKSLHGAALQLLASLNQYALIERKRGLVGISEDAFTILKAPADSPERKESIKRCSKSPLIFEKLLGQYEESLPSDESLKWELQKEGYAENAAITTIASLRDTISFVKLEKEQCNQISEPVINEALAAKEKTQTPLHKADTIITNAGQVVWTFPTGQRTASLTIPGDEPSRKEMEVIIKILQAFKESLPQVK